MESIVHFMYLGEATFYDDKMKDLLAVARNLQIKQMCDTIAKDESQKDFYQNEKDLNIKCCRFLLKRKAQQTTKETGRTMDYVTPGGLG